MEQDRGEEKLQAFGKRCRSVKRDPNAPVVIRGWLYKRDNGGLKLWKRRWFVLSDFCLFYYKDSREECVLGSVPLPSYSVVFCSPGECRNRKYAFKVVHQGMRSYWLSAETQEDMLGWVRALSQSACMETDDIMNRRCRSYQDFTQLGGSTESVERLNINPSFKCQYETEGMLGNIHHRGTNRESRAHSFSLDRTVEEYFLSPPPPQGSCPTPQRGHYGLRSHSPLGHVEMHLQDSSSVAQPTPGTHLGNSDSQCRQKESHTLSALQTDTDMVLTRLCGCDKLLQTLSMELSHLQADKDHAQMLLEMNRLQLDEWQLEEQFSQKALLQDELITIRARMCDVSLEMERVWVDYERMESELCVFRSHLQHICHFGLPQERSQAQRQLWMMEDILCGLKGNRTRFRVLLGVQGPLTLPPLLQRPSVHSEEYMQFLGEEQEAPSRPPLPHELQSTNHSPEIEPGWAEPCSKKGMMTVEEKRRRLRNEPRSANKFKHQESSTNQTNTPQPHLHDKPHLFVDDKAHLPLIIKPCFQINEKKNFPDDVQTHPLDNKPCPLVNSTPHLQVDDDKPHPPSPLRVLRVVSAVLPSSLSARRVCVQDPPHELAVPLPEQIHTLNPSQSNRRTPPRPPTNTLLRTDSWRATESRLQKLDESRESECDEAESCEKKDAKRRRVERIRERVMRSAARASDVEGVHPRKLLQIREHSDPGMGSCIHDNRSIKPRPSGEVCHRDEELPLLQKKTLSTNHVSSLTVNHSQTESQRANNLPSHQSILKHNSNCSASTNQRTEWFLSTSEWHEFIPINIQEEEQPTFATATHSPDHPANQSEKSKDSSMSEGGGGWSHTDISEPSSQNSQELLGKVTASELLDSASIQPAVCQPSNVVPSSSDQSGTELQIYEEIHYEEDHVNAVSGEKMQKINLFTNHNAEPSPLSNHSPAADKETGSDITKVYSCVVKNSVTNQNAPFLKHRVTMVSTSL